VPRIRSLREDLWPSANRPTALPGIDFNERCQLELLATFERKFKIEYDAFSRNKTAVPHEYYIDNHYFEAVDGEILYCFIRHFKPQRIIEIGSGYSTMLASKAISQNQQEDPTYTCTLTAIEPYPSLVLKTGFPHLSELVIDEVQNVSLSKFDNLTKNDILFIDSSHVLTIGNDVQYEYLKLLPRLGNGVIVHIHDIFLPREYPKEWVMKRLRFWTEQYILQAFLTFNESYEILWAAEYMHLNHPDLLENAFSSYARNSGGHLSFWIRKIK